MPSPLDPGAVGDDSLLAPSTSPLDDQPKTARAPKSVDFSKFFANNPPPQRPTPPPPPTSAFAQPKPSASEAAPYWRGAPRAIGPATAQPTSKVEDNPARQWYTFASIFGMMGSQFTQKPLTDSTSSAAKALDSYKKGDREAGDRAYDEWMTSMQSVQDAHDYQNSAYDDILSLYITRVKNKNGTVTTTLQIPNTDLPAIQAKMNAAMTAFGDNAGAMAWRASPTGLAFADLMSKRDHNMIELQAASLRVQKAVDEAREKVKERQIEAAEQAFISSREARGMSPTDIAYHIAQINPKKTQAWIEQEDRDRTAAQSAENERLRQEKENRIAKEKSDKEQATADRQKKIAQYMIDHPDATPTEIDKYTVSVDPSEQNVKVLAEQLDKDRTAKTTADNATTAAKRLKDKEDEDARKHNPDPKVREQYKESLKKYQVPYPTGKMLTDEPWKSDVASELASEDERYSAGNYQVVQGLKRDLTKVAPATLGGAFTSADRIGAHIDTMRKLLGDLHNAPTPIQNTIKNRIAQETGSPEIKAFIEGMSLIGPEGARAVSGQATALKDREEIREGLSPNASPAQTTAALDVMEQFIQGQIEAGIKTVSPYVEFMPEQHDRLARGLARYGLDLNQWLPDDKQNSKWTKYVEDRAKVNEERNAGATPSAGGSTSAPKREPVSGWTKGRWDQAPNDKAHRVTSDSTGEEIRLDEESGKWVHGDGTPVEGQ